MQLTVARIGRAQGLRGEVSVEAHTDIPEDRFAPGEVLATDPTDAGPLTVARSRTQGGRWYLTFDGVDAREAAEGLRGVLLTVDEEESDEDDAWYLHEIVGLRVERPTGELIGEVIGLDHLPGHDMLVVKEPNGNRAMIPFVEELVPEVDVKAGRVIADPPYGLLDGEAQENTGETAGAGS